MPIKFIIVGSVSNAVSYLIYALLALFVFEPKVAMTITFVIAVLLSFFGQLRYTFQSSNKPTIAFRRYLTLYLLLYIINWLGLYYFVDILKWNHLVVQFALIINAIIISYVVQKNFVFRDGKS